MSDGRALSVSQALARQARSLTFDDLPPEVVHEAKRRLIDALGCTLAGGSTPSGHAIEQCVTQLGGPAEASVLGSGLRTSAQNAALANGVMLRSVEAVDEGFAKSEGSLVRAAEHPGEIIPGVVAVGERQRSHGKDVITALVLGYELLSRFRLLFSRHEAGWTQEITVPYVVPLVAGKLLGLSEEQMVNAVGISGSFPAALKVLDDPNEVRTMARNLRFPLPAYQGIMAALLGSVGFTGPSNVIEGHHGFVDVMVGAQSDLTALTQPMDEFSIVHTGTKMHACYGRAIGAVDATLELVTEHEIDPDQVADVKVTTSPRTHATASAARHPLTRESADHSIHYLVAIAILDRAMTPEQFTQERLEDPRVRTLCGRVEHRLDPALQTFHSAGVVEIATDDGATYRRRVEVPKGKPENPMSDSEIEGKFADMAQLVMDRHQIAECTDAFFKLDQVDDIGQLVAMLVPCRARPAV